MNEAVCPVCGAPASTRINGLCAPCLMRLAVSPTEPEPEPTEETAADPHRLGPYELLDEIARGGMGIVYRARQPSLARVVALKVLLPQLAAYPGMRERFRREVEAVARLDDPGILPVYEVGEAAGLPYFSMKLAEGGTLEKRMEAFAGQWREIARLVVRLARAIEHAHGRGILHRDLKPANILFDSQDAPLITDFGLARLMNSSALLTMPTMALGSPNYMAPEQVSAEFGELGPRTDVYGLGAILYQLLTGQPPVRGVDALETLRRVTTDAPSPGSATRPDIPGDLEAIAQKCLAKKAADRYDSAAHLAADLERWLGGQQAVAVHQRRRRRSARFAAAGVGVALLAAAAGWLLRPRVPTPASASFSAPRSVGVVPFRNVSGDPRDDALTTMVTDDLLRDIRQVKSLDVLPFRVARDAASDGVEMLLLGDISRDAQGVQVQSRLWDARAQREVWRRTFTTRESDLRELRSQIAEALVTGLQLEVGADWRQRMSPDGLTRSADAYGKYLRARYLLRWRRPETLVEAARELKSAIALDSGFAQAHSALAAVYALWTPGMPNADGETVELAQASALTALALNPQMAEPHAVLASQATQRGDYARAESEFQKAMAADPHDPSALHFYAIHLYGVGRLSAALEIERRSIALDATSAQPMMWLAMLTTLRGDKTEAARLWQKTEELGATRPLAAAIVRLELDQPGEIHAWFRNRAERDGIPDGLTDEEVLIAGLTDVGRRPAALRWLGGVEKQLDPALAITLYALLDDGRDAVRIAGHYDLAKDQNYLLRPTNLWAPRTAALRRDPGFAALATRWGLANYWRRYAPADGCRVTARDVSCE